MRVIWLFLLTISLFVLQSAAQPEASTIELEVLSYGGLRYSLTLDAGGRLAVELIQEEDGFATSRTGGTASITPSMFQFLNQLLVDMGRSEEKGRWRREGNAVVVIRDIDGVVMEKVALGDFSPGRRRLLLDIFSILHSYASDVEIDLVGVETQNCLVEKEADAWSSIKWHLYLIEGGVLSVLLGFVVAVARKKIRTKAGTTT